MKEKKYPQIESTLPIKRVWNIFYLVILTIAFINKLISKVKLVKHDKLPKPPYILISNHASMFDFYMALCVTFPHKPYWISTVEEFVPRFFIFRRIGVLAKRKFTNDPKAVMKYLEVLKKKKILIFYPEARYSFTGEPERIDKSMGRFVKTANVPVVMIKTHGHYLQCPQWSDRKNRKFKPIQDDVYVLVNKWEAESLSAEEIQERIENNFDTSDELWMEKNNIEIKYENRAVGLERILYKCPHCGTEFEMSTKSHFLTCNHCGAEYDYLENGKLKCTNKEIIFDYPSKWYKWEKECVKKEVLEGTYHFEDDVRAEKLMGAGIGFVTQEGHYHLTHDINEGFILKGIDNDFEFHRTSLSSFAVHIEYDYLDRGSFLELADKNVTYFIYPLNKKTQLTKIHFAVEHIYDLFKNNLKKVNVVN